MAFGPGDADACDAGDADACGTGDAVASGTGDADASGTGDADACGPGVADERGAGDAEARGAGDADACGAGEADERGAGEPLGAALGLGRNGSIDRQSTRYRAPTCGVTVVPEAPRVPTHATAVRPVGSSEGNQRFTP